MRNMQLSLNQPQGDERIGPEIELWRYFSRTFKVCYSHYVNEDGFDIVKFDEEVIKSKDRVMIKIIHDEYGSGVARLIMALALTPWNVDGKTKIF